MKEKTFYIKTLGCKVNQVESAYIAEKLIEKGFIFSPEREAKILILNSCIVTEKAEAENLKIIKKWTKFNPKYIILAGCFAQKYFKDAPQLAEKYNFKKFLVLGHNEKLKIPEILEDISQKNISFPLILVNEISKEKVCIPIILNEFLNHSRAFIKIQDGCDNFCTYCIIPYVRGKPRSVSIDKILKQIEIFINKGYEEFVLTGINLGKWGKDFNPPQSLSDLLWEIEKLLSFFRKDFNLRLSSIEVTEIDKKFLDFAKNSKFLVPHFHIPLQSGSNKILKLMNRHYTREKYMEVLFKLYEIFPQATFGADVIIGFPGETEEDFSSTYEVIEKSPLNWLHIFPFSPRPGTPAERFSPKIPSHIIKKRYTILKELIIKKRKEFLEKEKGKIKKVVFEYFDKEKNMWKGLSENYIPVFVKLDTQNEKIKRKILKIKLESLENDYFIGSFLKTEKKRKV